MQQRPRRRQPWPSNMRDRPPWPSWRDGANEPLSPVSSWRNGGNGMIPVSDRCGSAVAARIVGWSGRGYCEHVVTRDSRRAFPAPRKASERNKGRLNVLESSVGVSVCCAPIKREEPCSDVASTVPSWIGITYNLKRFASSCAIEAFNSSIPRRMYAFHTTSISTSSAAHSPTERAITSLPSQPDHPDPS